MRDTFVRTLIELAKNDKNIELITGDLGYGVLKPFWEALPDQFTNIGINEQNMISVAAGMALTGKKVFVYSIGNFPSLRCLEQIRNDCAYHNADVKIICVGGGFVYGNLGMSHHATEDLAVLRALPDVVVMAPADYIEAEACVRAITKYKGTAYLRLGRGGEKAVHKSIDSFAIGKAIQIAQGKDVAIFSTGAILDEVQKACEELMIIGIKPSVFTFPSVKPIDRITIEQAAIKNKLILTCEENNICGGFGSAVAEVMAEMPDKTAKLLRIGIKDKYCDVVGDQKYLRKYYEIDSNAIVASIKTALK